MSKKYTAIWHYKFYLRCVKLPRIKTPRRQYKNASYAPDNNIIWYNILNQNFTSSAHSLYYSLVLYYECKIVTLEARDYIMQYVFSEIN